MKRKVKVGDILVDKETRNRYFIIDIDVLFVNKKSQLELTVKDWIKTIFGLNDIFITMIPEEDYDKYESYYIREEDIAKEIYIFKDDLKKYYVKSPDRLMKVESLKETDNVYMFGFNPNKGYPVIANNNSVTTINNSIEKTNNEVLTDK